MAGPLIDQIPAAIALFDTNLRCVMVSQQWQTQLPFPVEAPVDRPADELFANGFSVLRSYLERALLGEALSSDPAHIVDKNGTIFWFRSHVTPWRDGTDKVHGAMLLCENVTREIGQALQIKVLNEQLALYIDKAENFAFCLLDANGKVTLWNKAAERMTGWSELEVLSRTADFLFECQDQAADWNEQKLAVAREQGEFQDRIWCARKDGTFFRADVTIVRIDGDDLLPSGFGQILRDVTTEEAQTRSLEANVGLLRSILETIPDALVVIDAEGCILMFSKAAEKMFGYPTSEVLGRNLSILMPESDRKAHEAHLARYRQTGRSHSMGRKRRLIGQRKDGTEFPHALHLAEAFGGGQRMIAGFMHDLSAEEAAAAQLEQLQRELAHIARLHEMGTLATTIAHELNQPLMTVTNIVQTAAEILSNGDILNPKALAEALAEAGRESIRAGDILRRLRVFLSRGDLEKTLEDPRQLAEDAVYFEAAAARFRKIVCKVECEPSLPKILVDRVQIQQVIVNLVKNAIQSVGNDGKVAITIASERSDLLFTVSDTGPGVPPERVSRLFEPFSTTKVDGMGLGLPICKSIIEAHGGTIWYEPSSETGATFVFTLPKTVEEINDA
ncbi:MAG: PAS domain S-box protein [Porphyrobacter sp.]|nr:PAS domain S-box protein [Porphyrobacter sp.]